MSALVAGNLTTSSGMAHLQAILYKKVGLDRLMTTFRFREAAMEDDMAKQSGRTVQWFRYSNLSANTTPAPEGIPGTSLTPQSNVVTATVSEYSDFINLSTFLSDTAIDDSVKNFSDLLGYRGGLSVDTITRNVVDDQASSIDLALTGSYLRVADLHNGATQLQALNVQPMDDGYFYGIAHPYVYYDLINDPSAGGALDIFKYTAPAKSAAIDAGNNAMQDVITIGGVRLVRSTNVTKVAGSPNKWRVYIFGRNGLGAVGLAGNGPKNVRDPYSQRFNIKVAQYNGQPSVADPEGVIGASVSYRYVYTAVILDGPTGIGGQFRMRKIDCPSSIAA